MDGEDGKGLVNPKLIGDSDLICHTRLGMDKGTRIETKRIYLEMIINE